MKTDQHDKRQNRFSVRRYRRLATGYLPPILFAVGCSTSPLGTGGPATADVTCTSCHGSGENAAPPPAVGGSNGTSDPGVGAHRTHVLGGPLKKRFDCDACHTKPAAVSAPGHVNGVVDLTWGVLARAGGAMPVFDETTATCSSVYCHGATLPGGTNTTPVWTTVDGTQAKCGACHGAPPPAPHPPNKSCEMCHPDPEDGGKHVNGVLDKKFDELTCTICHGDPSTGDAAPPVGPGGETETTEAAVGAHRNHLGPSDWHRSVGCSDCHAVPTSTSHADGKTDFAFGDTARADGAAPQYDASKATCSSVYCHGATLFGAKTGGTVKREPVWTQVDGTFNACGASCHTNPPGGDHLANEACDLCHGQVIGLNGRWVNPALHVDGKVDVKSMVCNGCHGSADNNAPPVSTSGSSDTGDVTVGAHQSHVKDGALRAALDCTECHVVPAAWDAAGHIDTPPAEVTWGTLAVSDGANPGWDHNSATCSAVYCHGATLSGGTRTEPVWTTVDGTFDECGACHGVPPPWPHPYKSTCHDCHPGTVAADGTIDVAGGKHIDGELEVDYSSMTCSSCHGGVENAAPPIGTRGETETTEAAVGAHQKHVASAAWHRDGQCADCHAVPQSVSHSDEKTDFEWGLVSKADGASPAYDSGTHTCATTYCHGTTLKGANVGGKVNRTPEWTKVDGTYNECGTTCHTLPPGAGHAPAPTGCNCHGSVVTSVNVGPPATATWKNKDLHINGQVNY